MLSPPSLTTYKCPLTTTHRCLNSLFVQDYDFLCRLDFLGKAGNKFINYFVKIHGNMYLNTCVSNNIQVNSLYKMDLKTE